MNDTRIASKAKTQLASFMGKVFTHFSKPGRRFVEEVPPGDRPFMPPVNLRFVLEYTVSLHFLQTRCRFCDRQSTSAPSVVFKTYPHLHSRA